MRSLAGNMDDTAALFIGLIAAVPALYMLYTGLSLVRSPDARAGALSTLVALVNVAIALCFLVVDTFLRPLAPFLPMAVGVSGFSLLVFGVAVFQWVERRLAAFAPDYSYGLLAAGIGTLLITAALFIPILPSQFSPRTGESSLALASATATAEMLATATPSSTPSATATATQLPTRTLPTPSPTPSPTATPTRTRYHTRTPVPTPPANVTCHALVNFNLNLRSAPSTSADILTVIPFGSRISVAGRNSDSAWWFVDYNGLWGWVSGEYITVESSCQDTPILE